MVNHDKVLKKKIYIYACSLVSHASADPENIELGRQRYKISANGGYQLFFIFHLRANTC